MTRGRSLAFLMVFLCAVAWRAPSGQQSQPGRKALPAPERQGGMTLQEALARRASVRESQPKPLTDRELSQLLWAAQGITHGEGQRTAPSAGARYPLELYAATAAGFFHYQPREHQLARLSQADLRPAISKAALGQTQVAQAAAVFVFTAVMARTAQRYGEARTPRYVHIEIGHAAQNLLLQAVGLGLGAVPVGAFDDAQLQKTIPVPADHTVLYLVPVGHPR